MPELPEVETIASGLKKEILKKKISKISIFYPPIIKNHNINKTQTVKAR